MRAGEQLRKELTESGKFQRLDISPVNAAAHDSNLQACGGCEVRFAQQLGVDLCIIGQTPYRRDRTFMTLRVA